MEPCKQKPIAEKSLAKSVRLKKSITKQDGEKLHRQPR